MQCDGGTNNDNIILLYDDDCIEMTDDPFPIRVSDSSFRFDDYDGNVIIHGSFQFRRR